METWTIAKLKSELRARGAVLRGKKADLIKRLQAYIRNNNFVEEDANNPTTSEDIFRMAKPTADIYKDIHGESVLPNVTSQRIDLFLLRFGKTLTAGPTSLYNGKYLQCARYAQGDHSTGNGTFITGICRAQMKQVCYTVDVLLNGDGSIAESQCECAAGVGPYAHCKHILVLLLAVKDVSLKKSIVTAEVCTQKLQTFHKPKRPFNGSPVKSVKLQKSAKISDDTFDPRPVNYRNMSGYKDYVRNLCVNYSAVHSSTMPIKQTISPANPFAIVNDHTYAGNASDFLLRKLKLRDITKDECDEIELNTRGQSTNLAWKSARSCRLTSSRFKDIIRATERRDMKKLAESFIEPHVFCSKATEHGIVNESVALQKYEELTSNVVQKCGLFVVESHPFLGASPDGLVCDLTVVEVKCPYSSRNFKITPSTVPYLEMIDDELQLKKGHSYYYQIMGQLLATKRDFCDFIVYTYIDMVVISISRDQEFIDTMLNPLKSFFDNFFLPALLDAHIYHGYEVLQ